MPLDVLRNIAGERQYRVDAVTSIATSIQDNQSSIAGSACFAIGSAATISDALIGQPFRLVRNPTYR